MTYFEIKIVPLCSVCCDCIILARQLIWKSNHSLSLVSVLVLFRIHITISHQEILINALWANKQWVYAPDYFCEDKNALPLKKRVVNAQC